MVCPRCARENEDTNRFCGRCGLDFSDVSPSPPPAPGETNFCYRHKKEPTNLSCGRCGKFICHKCAIIGPAGPRCPECGRQKLPIQPRAVAATGKLAVSRIFRSSPYTLYIYLLIFMALFGGVRGCMCMRQPDDYVPRSRDYEEGDTPSHSPTPSKDQR